MGVTKEIGNNKIFRMHKDQKLIHNEIHDVSKVFLLALTCVKALDVTAPQLRLVTIECCNTIKVFSLYLQMSLLLENIIV